MAASFTPIFKDYCVILLENEMSYVFLGLYFWSKLFFPIEKYLLTWYFPIDHVYLLHSTFQTMVFTGFVIFFLTQLQFLI